jgi:prevent-host-death family protein
MARTVSLYAAKTHLSALVEDAAGGEEIVIAKNGRPKARLVPLPADPPPPPRKRELGFWEGQVWLAPDWDAPLPDDIIDEMLHGDEEDFDPPPPEEKGEDPPR